ncbi:hypothetical protein [Pseudomonas sp. LP_7_YM]|uniref:hypothetical protein n=1 Tax=Pseudomonas sp. LP_7_YM TaxID=2485137 RepID=UPI0010EBA2FE|nr:hypothetical protein [Pseudomonas sp. LP_7_YM]TDV72854.1 hypothetical protein EC915_1011002 [Pseudomonas sp. LP_7_YM]
MSTSKAPTPGEKINDPHAKPADVADDRERTQEARKEQPLTGGKHDDAGHTPKVPGAR